MAKTIGWLLAILLIAGACQGDADRGQTFGIGDAVADGQFTFTVTDFECGATRAGGEWINRDAQGTFCFLDVTVTNTGTEPRDLNAGAQRLIDNAGREFAADFGASWLETEDWPAQNVNPGSTMSMTVVFDIATPSDIRTVELHDSVLSRGVSVQLSGAVSSVAP